MSPKNKIKYIVVESQLVLCETIYLFPYFITHSDFAKRFEKKSEKIIAAGFVDIENKTCHGESISLDIKSRQDDNILLQLLLGC